MTTPTIHRAFAPIGVLLVLIAGLQACRAKEGDRCVCAEDCRAGLLCVAGGRVLEAEECTPVTGDNVTPGACVDEDEAAEDDGGGGSPEVFMDLGAKRDFDPGLPPDMATETGSETGPMTDGSSTGQASSGSGTGSSSTGSSSTGSSSTGAGSSTTGAT